MIALAIVAAVAFPLSTLLCGMQDGDGVLTALISTQKLTWYFWGQDRFLNFIPALAHPISDVVWNLRFQLFLRSFFAFLAPIGFLYFLTRSARTVTIATVLTNCVLALTLSDEALFNLYIQHNPFGTSLVLLAGAYATLARGTRVNNWRWALASVLLFLAYTTNFALFVISLPFLVVVLCLADENRKSLLIFIIVNVVAVMLAYVHAKHFGEAETQLGVAPSMQAIRAGYHEVKTQIRWTWIAALVFISVGSGFAVRAPNRWAAMLLIAGCLALIGVLSCASWAQINAYNVRYYLTFLIGIVAASGYLLITCVRNIAPFSEKYYAGVVWGLFLTAFIGGLHGLSATPGALLGTTWRQPSETVAGIAENENVQFVVGGFWDVWPAVFDTNARLQADGKAPTVYGGAKRGEALRDTLWKISKSEGSLRALCFLDSTEACAEAASNGLKANMLAVPHTERMLDAKGKPLLLLELRFADQNNRLPNITAWGQPPLKAQLVHIDLAASHIRFDPGSDSIIVPVTLRNDGTARLTPYGDHAVNLGARLTDEAGNVVNVDFARLALPVSDPGQEVHAEFNLPASQLEGHGLSILPVQEGVAWFDQFGVSPVIEGPFHRCNENGRHWMCDTIHALDAK
ncbi:hypothetical protein GCM10011408_35770 [Dyella caseinilytica]|nr:hypothetical protein GCM10011408_35770 [Dyella caseinilytica]